MRTVLITCVAASTFLTAACKKSDESQPTNSTQTSRIVNADISLDTHYDLDGNGDGITDCRFEIINLNPYNPNNPLTDSLAARIVMYNGSEFLTDFQTSYPDTFSEGRPLQGMWNPGPNGVLGAFHDLGKFKDTDNKYLGLRLNKNGRYTIGWVKLKCNETKTSVMVYEYAFKQNVTTVAGKK